MPPEFVRSFRGSSRLRVHTRGVTPGRKLVLLVHGLGGRGYETWAELPRLLLSAPGPEVDVGVFDYYSGHRRLGQSKSASITAIVDELGDEILASSYSFIVLTGHSLGGIIAQEVVHSLHSRELSPHRQTRRVAALVLFAAPRAGSLRVPRWLYTKDARYLRAHSENAMLTDNFFTDHIDCVCGPHLSSPRIPIPTFAGIATGDCWVDEFSAGYGLPANQKRRFPGSHKSIVKIRREGDAVLDWMRRQIDRADEAQQARSQAATAHLPGQVVVAFSGHPLEPAWDKAYFQALQAIDEASDATVRDIRSVGSSVVPTLMLRVIRLGDLTNATVRSELEADTRLQSESGRATLAIAIVGIGGHDAPQALYGQIGHAPPGASRWIENVDGESQLRDVIYRWMNNVAELIESDSRIMSRSDMRNSAVLRRETPRNSEDTDPMREYKFRRLS